MRGCSSPAARPARAGSPGPARCSGPTPSSSPGTDEVDLAAAVGALADLGLRHLLCEGGPSLFSSALAAGIVDELALTLAPTVVGGEAHRITAGPPLHAPDGVALKPRLLVEEAGTVLGLWRVSRG